MAITYSENGKKKVRKGDKKAIAMGKEFFGVPKNIREANKRLSGPGPYSTKDKRDVLLYYNKKNKMGKV